MLLCSPYKFYGPHLGLAYIRGELARDVAAVQGAARRRRAARHRYETGTLAHELLAGFVAAVEYLDDVGWEYDRRRASGRSRAVPRRPARRLDAARGPDDGGARPDVRAHARGDLAGRRGRSASERRGFAVWHGNYYAVEIMQRLGLPDGAVRVGIVHYNTEDEVDRLLDALATLAG